MKNTPGPWKISEINDGDVIAMFRNGVDEYFATIATVETGYLGGIANARLIAAAPELLEMLKVTAGNIASLRAANVCNAYDNWLENVSAVIVKAGGTPI